MSRQTLLRFLIGLTFVLQFGCSAVATPDRIATTPTVEISPVRVTPSPTQIPRPPLTETPKTIQTATSQPAQEILLFVKKTKTGSSPQLGSAINKFDLYSTTGKQTSLVASDVFQSSYLSPDGRMIANYNFGSEGQLQVITLDIHSGATKTTPLNIPDAYKDDSRRSITITCWSPDSAKLAVQTPCSLYIVTPAAGKFVETWYECYPQVYLHKGIIDVAWSPDGRQIAFTVVTPSGFPSSNQQDDLHGDYPAKLIVASTDGTAQKLLDEHGSHPVWSPDGQKILYTGGWRRDSDGDVYNSEKLYVINADGSGRIQLAETTGQADDSWTRPYYGNLGWSSDSKYVFFTQGRPAQSGQLTVIRSDGTGKVTLGGSRTGRATYLPQSNRIAWAETSALFISNLDGTNKITLDEGVVAFTLCGNRVVWIKGSTWFVSNLDGSDKSTFKSPESLRPLFSPNCNQLTFQGYTDEVDKVFIVDLLKGDGLEVAKAKPNERFIILGWVNPGR